MTRPTPIIPMKARGMPLKWRPIIEEELTAAQVSLRSIMDGKQRRYLARLRRRIWIRLVNETGAVPYHISKRFGFNHTNVYYALGRLTQKPGEYVE